MQLQISLSLSPLPPTAEIENPCHIKRSKLFLYQQQHSSDFQSSLGFLLHGNQFAFFGRNVSHAVFTGKQLSSKLACCLPFSLALLACCYSYCPRRSSNSLNFFQLC